MILVDTGPLVAVCDPRDSLHRRALEDLETFAARGLGVCEAVLVESSFHLPHARQRERIRALLAELDIEPVPTHRADFRDEVLDWLITYAEHEADWADACLAVLCGRDERSEVWTYDREFRTTWRTPAGKVIPLASTD